MSAQKKKIMKNNISIKVQDNKKYVNDKCPRKEKDCINCKILNCPEEVT